MGRIVQDRGCSDHICMVGPSYTIEYGETIIVLASSSLANEWKASQSEEEYAQEKPKQVVLARTDRNSGP
jgi:hypothetical protein